jgi:hypothetical protein
MSCGSQPVCLRNLYLDTGDIDRLEEGNLTDGGRLEHALNPGVCPQYQSVQLISLDQLK